MNAKSLATALLLAVSCTASTPAFAQLPDAPAADASSAIGIDAFSFWAGSAAPSLSADAPPILLAQADATPATLPIAVSAGTGAQTRLGVDLAAADQATEGWPWYAKAGLVVGCIAVAGLATWAVVDACDGGRHDNDQSQRIDLHLDGEGNTLTVHFHTDEPHNTTTTGR